MVQSPSAAASWTVGLAAQSHGQARARTLSAPTGVTTSCSGLTVPIVVSWTAVANATSYGVYRSAGGGPYTLVTTVNAPTTTASYNPGGVLQSYTLAVTVTLGTAWTSGLSAPGATRTVTALLVCT